MKIIITAQDIDKLTKVSGAGMMDCKKALTEAHGDFEKAIKILDTKWSKTKLGNDDYKFEIPSTCPSCKNPNSNKLTTCEWCGNKII